MRVTRDAFAISPIHYRTYRGAGSPAYFDAPADSDLLSALEDDPQRVRALRDWTFRKDPGATGLKDGWYDASVGEPHWRAIETPSHWTNTWVGDYLGYGWYRTRFDLPDDSRNGDLTLHFEGVDEQAWVFLNGRYVGEHTVASERSEVGELWDKPFTIRVDAKHVRPDAANTLTVLVHASASNGGIWRTAWLIPG